MRLPLFLTQGKYICKPVQKTSSTDQFKCSGTYAFLGQVRKKEPWPRKFNDRSIDRSAGWETESSWWHEGIFALKMIYLN